MKYSFGLAALAAAACVFADEDTCTFDTVEAKAIEGPVVNTTIVPLTPANTTNLFAPAPAPGVDTHDIAYVVPQANVSLYYGSNITTSASVNINHTMKYPTVVLEQIASIISVDCSNTSVAMTFNNSNVFATTQAAWIADGTMVFITNHLGDCDPILERSFFLSSSLSFDNVTLTATASSVKANVSSTAGKSSLSRTDNDTDNGQLSPKSHWATSPAPILPNGPSPPPLTRLTLSTLPSPFLPISHFTRTPLTSP